ncbi:MAG: transglutaminase-like domain-containing protein [Anaerolineales bacterium]|jgi:transglutaminase-like putative cysteine protease
MNTSPKNKANIRWGDWLSAILLIIIMQIAAARLVATLWTKYLPLVQVITLIGTLLGLALGKSIFKRFWVVILAGLYGVILIPWQLGLTLEIDTTWRDRLGILGVRLEVVIQELLTRKPVTDSILFLLLMAMLFWSLSIYAGVVLLREANPWKVIIPGGISVFVIHSFDPLLVNRSWYLAFYLFFSLILVARLVYIKNKVIWKERHTHTPPDMGFDFSRVALVLSMILVFFAWNVPVVAETFKPAVQIWQTASKPWLTVKDRFSFMFASLRASVGLVQNFYGDSLPLGLGTPLSNRVVLEVEAPTNPPNGDRFYWEARVYDTYESNQWLSTIKTAHDLTSESVDLNQPGVDARPVVTFIFFPQDPISNLFTVPEPLWVSLPTHAYMNVNPDGTVDFSTLISKDFVHPGDQYTTRSAIDVETVSELQAASTSYPEWVHDEYLQLPNNISTRTRELAKNISAGLSNPYDIANAVTDYLRNNIEYNQSISQPPPNQERIDWFLFDYKQGFCNYYASAEVILLRTLGIPARIAVGFAQGEREVPPIQQLPPGAGPVITQEQISETSTYVVRQKDAHAWPEVFFPEIGWVIFEPTVSQLPLFRPSGEPITTPDERQTSNEQDGQNQPGANDNNRRNPGENDPSFIPSQNVNFWTLGNILKLFVLLFALVILIIVIWQVRRGFKVKPFLERVSIEVPERLEKGLRRLGIRPPDFLINWVNTMRLPGLSRSYLEINYALDRIGRKPSIQDTPYERTASLISAIPAATTPAERLLAEYQTSEYSPHPADSEVAKKAGRIIRNLSLIAWINRFLSRFQEPSNNH